MKRIYTARRIAAAALAMGVSITAIAGISIVPDRPSALYRAGEETVFTVTVAGDDGEALKSGEAVWKLDNFGEVEFAAGSADLAKGNPFTVKGMMGEPGFLRLIVKSSTNSAVQSVGYDVEKIRQDEPCPADFDEYWAAEKARLEREVPLDARRKFVARLSGERQDVYLVSFATFGGKRVYGFLRVPRLAAKPLPLVVQVTDAGIGAVGPWINADDAVSLTMNVHTFEPGETAAEQRRRMEEQNAKLSKEFGFKRTAYCGVIGIGVSREKYHYHDVMLGINRAVDWAAALPEVDPSRVVYFGSSQGGGFGMWIPMLIIFAIFYFMMIKPQQRKEKERRKMISELRAGARVVFAGGLLGTIVEAKETTFKIEIAGDVVIEVARNAVQGLAAEEMPASAEPAK